MILFNIVELNISLCENDLKSFFADKKNEAETLIVQAIEDDKVLDEGVFADFFQQYDHD